MQRMPVADSRDTRGDPRMHGLDEQLEILHACLGRHAMAEVEDVAGPAAGPPQHVACALADQTRRTEEDRGLEVALDDAVAADARPRLVELNTPVDRDQVGTRPRDGFEKVRSIGTEVD